jgi:RHS repeat-associated protein
VSPKPHTPFLRIDGSGYDPYGRLTESSGPAAADNSFRFSTKNHDDATGLINYGPRYYAPIFGRWLSGDVVGERGAPVQRADVPHIRPGPTGPFSYRRTPVVQVDWERCVRECISEPEDLENCVECVALLIKLCKTPYSCLIALMSPPCLSCFASVGQGAGECIDLKWKCEACVEDPEGGSTCRLTGQQDSFIPPHTDCFYEAGCDSADIVLYNQSICPKKIPCVRRKWKGIPCSQMP